MIYVMKYARSLIAALVLLHALITAPLLVECISTDGRFLLEILGHDPCHEPVAVRTLPGHAREAAELSKTVNKGDPCVDLMVDGPAGTQTCDDFLMPPLQVSDGLAYLQDARPDIDLASYRHGPDVHPGFLRSSQSKIRLTLRI